MAVLLEEFSPHGNLQAVVDASDGVVYFYLWAGENSAFGMRSCWVRNLERAPDKLDYDSMKTGQAPLLPGSFCKHPEGADMPSAEQLRIVWFEEGDAAALLENNEILCIIPSWSGQNGFSGFARDCIGESALCWELDLDNELKARVKKAEEFWKSWETDQSQIWAEMQSSFLESMENCFGPHQKYYAIDGDNWPPKALLQFSIPGGIVLLTLGVSIRPQPQIEIYLNDPQNYRRVEFGICLADTPQNQGLIQSTARYISALSRSPWDDFTWFAGGHTVSCDLFEGFSAFVLSKNPQGCPALRLPELRGETVNILWLTPITAGELELAKAAGSPALFDALCESDRGMWMHAR